MTKTKLDTIKMMRRIRDENYEQTKNKNHEDRIAYYHAKAVALRQKLSQSPERLAVTKNNP
jgi:hypothetical protein